MHFNNALEKSSVTSTEFTSSDGNKYCLVDDGLGCLKVARSTAGIVDSPTVYFTLPDGTENQGTIDYTTGKVVLNNFNPHAITDGTTYIKLTVTPSVNNSDISPLREQVLSYDVTDTASIVINMVAETII